jgi:hypothetical protein
MYCEAQTAQENKVRFVLGVNHSIDERLGFFHRFLVLAAN